MHVTCDYVPKTVLWLRAVKGWAHEQTRQEVDGSLSKVLDRDRGLGLSHGAEAAVSRLCEAAVFPETGLS